MALDFARRLRSRQPLVGYWVVSDNPPATERLAAAGYDYLVLDTQHGMLDGSGAVRGLIAVDAGAAAGGTSTAGVVRVPSIDEAAIYRALDGGALGVIIPLVDSPAEAARAVAACRYPPAGIRSFGPTRSGLRSPSDLNEVNQSVACIAMIETPNGLEDVKAICAVPGLDAVYIGPSDLGLAVGGTSPAQAWTTPEFAAALERIKDAAAGAGIGCGMHCTSGEMAAAALREGFTFASVSNDLSHIDRVARSELAAARATPQSPS